MGDGTKENPFTREDVLKAIEQNGGTAKGLDLSGKVFKEGIDLRNLNLGGIILEEAILIGAHLEGAGLWGAHLEEADLTVAHLQGAFLSGAYLEGADLMRAHLEEAHLSDAHLEGADLRHAHLEGAHLSRAHLEGAGLYGVEFTSDTRLEGVDWGNYILRNEIDGHFSGAVDTYRRLKVWYKNAGISDIEGEFLYREMKCKRKQSWWGDRKQSSLKDLIHPFKPRKLLKAFVPKEPVVWALLTGYDVLCGYGERIRKILLWIPTIIFGCAAAYYFGGSFSANFSSFWDALYYSAVSFTAVGYGNWAPQPEGWARGMGVAEAFIGVFMIALFLVTFTRKMTR